MLIDSALFTTVERTLYFWKTVDSAKILKGYTDFRKGMVTVRKKNPAKWHRKRPM